MRPPRVLSLGLGALALLAAACGSSSPADLEVSDLQGRAHHLFQESEAQAVVLLFVAPECPISNALAPEVQRICDEYAPRGVDFFLVYSEGTLTEEEIERHVSEFGYTVPALLDFDQRLVDHTGATVTPEVSVLLPDGEQVYLGRINDLFSAYGKRRAQPTTSELRDALDAVLAGRKPPTARIEAIGCFIPDRVAD